MVPFGEEERQLQVRLRHDWTSLKITMDAAGVIRLGFVRIFLHQKPGNRGHVLVIPKHHVANLFESPSILDAPLLAALRRALNAVKKAFSADGIQVRQNNGAAARQDVFHLHFHVIPRYDKVNFEDTDHERLPLGERMALADKLKSFLHHDA